MWLIGSENRKVFFIHALHPMKPCTYPCGPDLCPAENRHAQHRRGEAVSLRRDQIDFARRIVTFTGDTKSGKSRQAPLTDAALKAITDMPVHGSHIFYNPNTLNPWRGDTLLRVWEKARGKSKLRIHDLRHAYAIRLAESGCAMYYISEVLGHLSGVDFTHHRYARFSPESAMRAVLYALEGHKTGTDN